MAKQIITISIISGKKTVPHVGNTIEGIVRILHTQIKGAAPKI